MTTLTTNLYEVVTTHPECGEISNHVGVMLGGWDERIIDTDTDRRVFYFMDQDEFDQLTAGTDLTGDSDVVVSINRVPDYTFTEEV